MRNVKKPSTPAAMYDYALRYARDKHLPADYPKPRPTSEWPAENISLLEEYCDWLRSSGLSSAVIRTIYLPMAGHVLGLALTSTYGTGAGKPHPELNLESDLERAFDFLKAKQLSAEWTRICQRSMFKFRRFLMHKRGLIEVKLKPYIWKRDTEGLPEWLVTELERLQHVKQRNWREARLEYSIRNFWAVHLRLWKFLCGKCGVKELADIKRKHLLDFMDTQLTAKYAASTINTDVRTFHGFLDFLQEEGFSVPRSLFAIPSLKQPEPLPKFLTDGQVKLLRDEFEQRVVQAKDFRFRRDALLDRAAFYLLWQSGLRLGEVEELHLEDLDLAGKKLIVRQSKGMKDRTVFMTDTTLRAVQEYLKVRGPGPTEHVFLFRNQPLCKDLIPSRLKYIGERVGVKVHPHRLRHTMATQLLNAGCRVTSLQKFLGHKELSTTMIYARVHDQTVADDYYSAMQKVEQRLDLVGSVEEPKSSIHENERVQLLELIQQVANPELSIQSRLEITDQMRQVLMNRQPDAIPARLIFESKLNLSQAVKV